MYYRVETCAIEMSVYELCALAHKSGSLDARHPRRRAEALGAAPKKEVREREAGYRADLPLCHTVLFDGITFTVEGMACGVIETQNGVTVEAFKLSQGRSGGISPSDDVYSRLRCYAHFLCVQKSLSEITLRVRICNTRTKQTKDLLTKASAEELRVFYESLLARVVEQARFEILRREELIPSVCAVRFPYPNPREGQSELAEACFKAIRRGKRLFANAPTGIGKTMSTLYPAVKAIGEGYCDRVFYLTAKASTRREAYAAAGKLFEAGARLRTVVLYAKEQMCLCEGGCRAGGVSRCHPELCPYAKGYYDRVDGALRALLSRQNGFPMRILKEVGREHRVCPYELSLDLSERCEIIICDYNYAFDPAVYLRRYFDAREGERGRYAFLVDEAHNLPDRVRDMYSCSLSSEALARIYAQIDPVADSELEADLGAFLIRLRSLGALCTEHASKNEDGTKNGYYLNRAPLIELGEDVDLFCKKVDAFLRKNGEHPQAPALAELCSSLRRFGTIFEYYDSRFLTYIQMQSDEIEVRLICLDPAGIVDAALSRASAAVLFSATLLPMDYFVDVLGGGKGAQRLELPSPYDPERLCVTVASGVSTKMEDRARSYKRVSSLIAATVSARAGNYMVYFPSYDYLEQVLAIFKARYPKVNCIVQTRQMTLAQRESFLAEFKDDEGVLRVGFCVLGGSFSEGVDLPGSRLIGAVVVGVGIPGLSDERNILRDYFEVKCERGYDYAYTFPGMNRVLQAAGRVIRREEDRGVVVLVDSRYAEEPYLHLYPGHWQGIVAAGDAASLARRLQLFWQGEEKKF